MGLNFESREEWSLCPADWRRGRCPGDAEHAGAVHAASLGALKIDHPGFTADVWWLWKSPVNDVDSV